MVRAGQLSCSNIFSSQTNTLRQNQQMLLVACYLAAPVDDPACISVCSDFMHSESHES